MPRCDGCEATRRIRIYEEDSAKQPVFVVALTGAPASRGRLRACSLERGAVLTPAPVLPRAAHAAEDGDGESSWAEKGFSDMLPKPINPSAMRALLKKRHLAMKMPQMAGETAIN